MEIIYQKAGLRRVINASGRMTALGVSTIHDETGKTMVEAAQNYVSSTNSSTGWASFSAPSPEPMAPVSQPTPLRPSAFPSPQ